MTRTTIDLDPSVLEELRRRGRREGKSMGRLASELLVAAISSDERQVERRSAFKWRTASLGRTRVDLDDKEAVRALLDRSA